MNMEQNSIALRVYEVTEEIAARLRQIQKDIENPDAHSASRMLQNIAKVKARFGEFETAPKLLDSHLQLYMDLVSNAYLQLKKETKLVQNEGLSNSLAELVYELTKVRGDKYVANFLASDVYLLPQLVGYMRQEGIEDSDCECFLVLLWLSRLVMVPFPLRTVHPDLDTMLYSVATRFLAVHTNASKTQRISLILLSRLLTRPDLVEMGLLELYLDTTSSEWAQANYNFKLGHLMAINQILKSTSSTEVTRHAHIIYKDIVAHDLILVKYRSGLLLTNMNVLFLIKVLGKLARIYLLQLDYATVSAIVNNMVNDIMNPMVQRFDANLRESMAKTLSRLVGHLSTRATNYASQLNWYMFRQLRIPQLMVAGKPTYHKELTLDPSNLHIAKYHTVLLFLGHLALTRCAPIEVVPAMISLVHQTFFISQRTLSFVQGSQVRDSSLFCVWAVLRMLSRGHFELLNTSHPGMFDDMFEDLLKVVVFDEDFTIRRCGIAVLQEFVGRFGSVYFSGVLKRSDASEIGAFTIRFIELFGATSVGTLSDSYELLHSLVALGFPKALFVGPILKDILSEDVPFIVQKLGSKHLARLLAEANVESVTFSSRSQEYDISETIAQLYPQESCLYCLGEFLASDILTENILMKVTGLINSATFDHHQDSGNKGEALLHWINACLTKGASSPLDMDNMWTLVFAISRSQATKEMISEFRAYFSGVSEIPPAIFKEICRYLKNGNVLFAQAIASFRSNANQVNILCSLASDPSVDAGTRALVVSGISPALYSQERDVSKFLDFLDDYTLTKQGDVGLKVRFAGLHLVKNNLASFRGSDLKSKLIRISGEVMDKLRVKAFSLLCELDGIDTYANNYHKYNNDYSLYFSDFFEYYASTSDQDEAFWRGIVHCAGAITGANTVINTSFNNVLSLLYEGGPVTVDMVMTQLVRGLKVPEQKDQRAQKTVLATLNLVGKILDAGIPLPDTFNCEGLFIRAYNLHINNLSVSRVALVLKIFQYLSVLPEVPESLKQKTRQRVCWLCCLHPNPRVRVLASESVFEIANELDPNHSVIAVLNHTKWDSGEAKPRLQELKLALSCI